MQFSNIVRSFVFVLVALLITNCDKNIDYTYHNLHLSKGVSIDNLRQMNYEIGAVMRKHTSKYDDETKFNDKTYRQFDNNEKMAIISTLKNELHNKFYNGTKPSNHTKTISINFLTDTKTYKKQRTCNCYRSCGRRCTERWIEPCMKNNYNVITNIIGVDKGNKSNVLFQYKIKLHFEKEDSRYGKNLKFFDEYLEYQVKQFVEDLVENNIYD